MRRRTRAAMSLRVRPAMGPAGGRGATAVRHRRRAGAMACRGRTARCNHTRTAEPTRVRGGRDRGVTAVEGSAQRVVVRGHALVLGLRLDGTDVLLAPGGDLLRVRPRLDAARAAVVAHVIDRDVVDHGAVVDVGDVGRADVGYGAVVEQLAAAPLAAGETDAAVAKAVVDAA